jgi:hypothetical protein
MRNGTENCNQTYSLLIHGKIPELSQKIPATNPFPIRNTQEAQPRENPRHGSAPKEFFGELRTSESFKVLVCARCRPALFSGTEPALGLWES